MVPSTGDLVHYGWDMSKVGLVLGVKEDLSGSGPEETHLVLVQWCTDSRLQWVPCDRFLEIRSHAG